MSSAIGFENGLLIKSNKTINKAGAYRLNTTMMIIIICHTYAYECLADRLLFYVDNPHRVKV